MYVNEERRRINHSGRGFCEMNLTLMRDQMRARTGKTIENKSKRSLDELGFIIENRGG